MEKTMGKHTPLTKLRNGGKSFFESVGKTSELSYLVLLTAYVVIYIILKVSWSPNVADIVSNIRYCILSLVMWGSTIYLFFVIVEWRKLWKNTPALIVIGAVLIAITGYYSTKMSTNSYGVVMDIFFCLMAYGKDYKKILKCIMWATIVMLIIAWLCLLKGYTYERPKMVGEPGHSLGINYPNSWGYVVFLAMMTGWYSYLRGKHVLTFIIFWVVSAFMYFYVLCRTIAVLTIVFPVIALFVDWLEKRSAKTRKGIGVMGWFWTITPFLALAFVLFVSMNYVWVHANVPDSSFISTIKYRFIHNGLYIHSYGVPFAGNAYKGNIHNFINVNGEFIEPGLLDCSYISYLIMRGALWTGYTLLWLCITNYKAYKIRDYATNFLCAILLVFAMIERVGLEMWYCFVLLYPLAKVCVNGKEYNWIIAKQVSQNTTFAENALISTGQNETPTVGLGNDSSERINNGSADILDDSAVNEISCADKLEVDIAGSTPNPSAPEEDSSDTTVETATIETTKVEPSGRDIAPSGMTGETTNDIADTSNLEG